MQQFNGKEIGVRFVKDSWMGPPGEVRYYVCAETTVAGLIVTPSSKPNTERFVQRFIPWHRIECFGIIPAGTLSPEPEELES